MQSIILTSDDIDMIAQSLAMYGFIGLLVALFAYDLLAFIACRTISWFRLFFEKPTHIDISERRARAKAPR